MFSKRVSLQEVLRKIALGKRFQFALRESLHRMKPLCLEFPFVCSQVSLWMAVGVCFLQRQTERDEKCDQCDACPTASCREGFCSSRKILQVWCVIAMNDLGKQFGPSLRGEPCNHCVASPNSKPHMFCT